MEHWNDEVAEHSDLFSTLTQAEMDLCFAADGIVRMQHDGEFLTELIHLMSNMKHTMNDVWHNHEFDRDTDRLMEDAEMTLFLSENCCTIPNCEWHNRKKETVARDVHDRTNTLIDKLRKLDQIRR